MRKAIAAPTASPAMFEELLLHEADLTIYLVGQTYTEPIRDLMLAAQADPRAVRNTAPDSFWTGLE